MVKPGLPTHVSELTAMSRQTTATVMNAKLADGFQPSAYPDNLSQENIVAVAKMGPPNGVDHEAHRRFCEVFSIGVDRASFAEWNPPEHHLTIPQWWRKMASLKTNLQWKASILRIIKSMEIQIPAEDEFNQLPSDTSKNPKWDLLAYVLEHIMDPRTFVPRRPLVQKSPA